jgi:hypothetical protein
VQEAGERHETLISLFRVTLMMCSEFGGNVAGLSRADPVEDLPRLAQAGPSLGRVARGQGAAARAGTERAPLPGTFDFPGSRQAATA